MRNPEGAKIQETREFRTPHPRAKESTGLSYIVSGEILNVRKKLGGHPVRPKKSPPMINAQNKRRQK